MLTCASSLVFQITFLRPGKCPHLEVLLPCGLEVEGSKIGMTLKVPTLTDMASSHYRLRLAQEWAHQQRRGQPRAPQENVACYRNETPIV
jgi:hypothetical protein